MTQIFIHVETYVPMSTNEIDLAIKQQKLAGLEKENQLKDLKLAKFNNEMIKRQDVTVLIEKIFSCFKTSALAHGITPPVVAEIMTQVQKQSAQP